jgi:hypothetical protein
MRISESHIRRIIADEARKLKRSNRIDEYARPEAIPANFDSYIMETLKEIQESNGVGFEDAIDTVRGRVEKVIEEYENWCFENGIPQVTGRF